MPWIAFKSYHFKDSPTSRQINELGWTLPSTISKLWEAWDQASQNLFHILWKMWRVEPSGHCRTLEAVNIASIWSQFCGQSAKQQRAHQSSSVLERPLVYKAPNAHGDPVSNKLPPLSVRGGTDPTMSGSHLFPLPLSIGGGQGARAPCHCSQKKILATLLYPTSQQLWILPRAALWNAALPSNLLFDEQLLASLSLLLQKRFIPGKKGDKSVRAGTSGTGRGASPRPAAGCEPAHGLANSPLLFFRFRLGAGESQLLRGLVVKLIVPFLVFLQRLGSCAAARLPEQQAVLRLLLRGGLALVHHRRRRHRGAGRARPELHHDPSCARPLTRNQHASGAWRKRQAPRVLSPSAGSQAPLSYAEAHAQSGKGRGLREAEGLPFRPTPRLRAGGLAVPPRSRLRELVAVVLVSRQERYILLPPWRGCREKGWLGPRAPWGGLAGHAIRWPQAPVALSPFFSSEIPLVSPVNQYLYKRFRLSALPTEVQFQKEEVRY